MTLAQLLAERRHVLLDFDGPVCAVFGGVPADHIARHYTAVLRAHGTPLPASVDHIDDPFAILHTAAAVAPADIVFAEHTLRDLELQAITTAPLTPGAVDALRALRDSGHTVTIVSNNSSDTVHAFLTTHSLDALVRGVVARTDPDPALLKPNPHLLRAAITDLHVEPGVCVLIGDSATDITAAHAAGTAVIAYANKPGKHARFAPYRPDVVIDSMTAIADALQPELTRQTSQL